MGLKQLFLSVTEIISPDKNSNFHAFYVTHFMKCFLTCPRSSLTDELILLTYHQDPIF